MLGQLTEAEWTHREETPPQVKIPRLLCYNTTSTVLLTQFQVISGSNPVPSPPILFADRKTERAPLLDRKEDRAISYPLNKLQSSFIFHLESWVYVLTQSADSQHNRIILVNGHPSTS